MCVIVLNTMLLALATPSNPPYNCEIQERRGATPYFQ